MAFTGGISGFVIDPATQQPLGPTGTPVTWPEAEAAAAAGEYPPTVITSVTTSGLGSFGQVVLKVADVFTYGAASAYIQSDPDLKQAWYGGTEYRPQPPAPQPLVVAGPPQPEPYPFSPALISRLLGDQGYFGGAAMNGNGFGGYGDDYGLYGDVSQVGGDYWSSIDPFSYGAGVPYGQESDLRGIMGGTGYDDYSSPLPPGYLAPGETSGMPGGGSEVISGFLGELGGIVRAVGGFLGLGGRSAGPSVSGPISGILSGLGGATPLLRQGIGATTGGIGMLGSIVPAIGTAVGRVTATRAWSLVRRHGLAAVATALGIGATELAQWLMANPPRRRRRRGISARDVRTTKRVVGFVCRVSDQLRSIKGRKRIC